jgi:hypothetical protein
MQPPQQISEVLAADQVFDPPLAYRKRQRCGQATKNYGEVEEARN